MQKISFYIFLFFIRFIALFSFKTLYKLSDILALFFYYAVAYRKDVIFENLKKAFPDKNKKELVKIAKNNYRNLIDITLETFKSFDLNNEELKKRFIVNNLDIIQDYFNKNKSVVAVLGHFCNWELGAQAAGLYLPNQVIGLYKPLKNKLIDDYIKNKRDRKILLTSIYKTKRMFLEKRKEANLYLLISDQSPSSLKRAHWVNFFNIETAALHGAENYAKVFDYPVVFIDVQRKSRGFYEASIEILEENTKDKEMGEVTQKFMSRLEEQIKENPANWLWSHKRWKRTKEDLQNNN